MLIIPAALTAGMMVLPLAYLTLRALQAGGEVLPLLFRSRTLVLLTNSLGLTLAVTAASTLLAVPLAWLTTRTDLPLRRLWTILSAVPLVIPSYVGAFALVAALGPRGALQQWVQPLGVERLPEIYGFPGALLALTLFTYPYQYLSVRSGLQSMDPALEEAARGLGHSQRQVFFRVVLPQLFPAVAAGGLLVALYTLSDFGAVSLLQFDTFTRAIYLQYQAAFDRSFAAALSLVLVALILGVLYLESRVRRQAGRYHRAGSGAPRPAPTVALGPWRGPALLFVALVVLLALVMPVAVVSYWLIRGLAAGEPLRLLVGPALNSALVSALAAVAAVLLGLPIAVLAVRYRSPATAVLERLTYVGYGLPGIVVALALVFVGVHLLYPLYQTTALLVLAYVLLFLPQAVGALRASLQRVDPHLEEAARGLGLGPLGVIRRVTWPLIRPGVAAGAALVFLTAMKELPATLLLSPIGFRTLATSIWSATEEAFFARAAAPVLLLILVSSLSLVLILRGRAGGGSEP